MTLKTKLFIDVLLMEIRGEGEFYTLYMEKHRKSRVSRTIRFGNN